MDSAGLALCRLGLRATMPAGLRAGLAVLIYHRVLPEPDPLFPEAFDARRFDEHLRWIRVLFNVLPLEEAVERLRAGSLPERAAAVTFDDGYADNAQVALPLLRRHGLSATFFVSTGFLDGGRMWNDTVIESVRRAQGDAIDLSPLGLPSRSIATPAMRRAAIDVLIGACKYLPSTERNERVTALRDLVGAPLPSNLMMAARQVRELKRAGMGIGAHTISHPILARVDAQAARREIAEGRSALEGIVCAPVKLFAYPNGTPGTDYTGEHARMVQDLGFTAAFSTAWGVARKEGDFMQLPRFTPWDRGAARFGIRLLRNSRRRSGLQTHATATGGERQAIQS